MIDQLSPDGEAWQTCPAALNRLAAVKGELPAIHFRRQLACQGVQPVDNTLVLCFPRIRPGLACLLTLAT